MKKAATIENDDTEKGALLISREWNNTEKKAMSNFIDAVKNKNIAKQKALKSDILILK